MLTPKMLLDYADSQFVNTRQPATTVWCSTNQCTRAIRCWSSAACGSWLPSKLERGEAGTCHTYDIVS
jgi:hypothetical protein